MSLRCHPISFKQILIIEFPIKVLKGNARKAGTSAGIIFFFTHDNSTFIKHISVLPKLRYS